MDKEKLIKQLFVGKVSDVIGFNKTMELLKEAAEAINGSDSKSKSEAVCPFCKGEGTVNKQCVTFHAQINKL